MKRSHAQTRPTLRLALGFLAAAALVGVSGREQWLALHLLFPGGIVLAISGVSLMLTVTWAAAPAPPERWVSAQRYAIAAGVVLITAGRTADAPEAIVGAGGALFIVGLMLLAGLLVVTIRAGVERRFDVAVASYLAALAAGTVGASLGIVMAVDGPSPALRSAHVTANLFGLVGLTVGGTLPFFSGTVGRSRMAKRTTSGRLLVSLGWQVVMLSASVVLLAVDSPTGAAVTLVGYAMGIGAALFWMPVPTRRQLEWAGPRLYALWAGGLWWATAVLATAADSAGDQLILGGRWLLVLAVAGYGQIVWGSLAYLLPMLRGGGPKRLAEGFTTTRSWLGFAAVNVAGGTLAVGQPRAGAAAVAVWVIDGAVRAFRVGTTRHDRPVEE